MEEIRVLPAAIYDELKRRADAVGGVGAGSFLTEKGDAPLCLHGLAGARAPDFYTMDHPYSSLALRDIGIGVHESDGAVVWTAVRLGSSKRTGLWPRHLRVPFDELMLTLRILRGPDEIEKKVESVETRELVGVA
jgi:hypothetical protein